MCVLYAFKEISNCTRQAIIVVIDYEIASHVFHSIKLINYVDDNLSKVTHMII